MADEPVRCKPISVDLELLIGSTQEMVEAMGRLKKPIFWGTAEVYDLSLLLVQLMNFSNTGTAISRGSRSGIWLLPSFGIGGAVFRDSSPDAPYATYGFEAPENNTVASCRRLRFYQTTVVPQAKRGVGSDLFRVREARK